MGQIAVMGAGVAGLALAWELARRGAPVRVLEAAHPGAGASGGLVGALAPHTPDGWTPAKALQLRALQMAPAFWAEVAATGGTDPGYARTGRIQPLTDAAAIARAESRAVEAAQNWGSAFTWSVRRTADVPGLRLTCAYVAHDTLTARIAPRRAIAALVSALAARGVTVEPGTEPPDGTAVWATGAAGLTATSLGGPEKGQAALLATDWRGAPVITAPGLYVVPHADGTVAVGSTSERGLTDTATDAQLDTLIQRARTLCPDLADAPVIERWAGLRPRAVTRQPVLGPLPGQPGQFILNGGFKTGFALAPLMAALLADLLLNGTDQIPPDWRA